MKRFITIFVILFALAWVTTIPRTEAAFQKATVVGVRKIRDSAGTVTGLEFLVRLHDDAIATPEVFEYVLTGPEFAALPAGAAAKRAALIAILKRESEIRYNAWIARLAAQPQPPLVSDPLADLGANEFTTFTGAAPPFPSPSPSP